VGVPLPPPASAPASSPSIEPPTGPPAVEPAIQDELDLTRSLPCADGGNHHLAQSARSGAATWHKHQNATLVTGFEHSHNV